MMWKEQKGEEETEKKKKRKISIEAQGMQICGEQCEEVMRVEQNKYYENQV